MSIAFAYLTAFSQNGGIEKFNKAFMKAMLNLYPDREVKILSAHDDSNNIDERYVAQKSVVGFSGSKVRFVLASLKQLYNCKLLIIGHINLSPLAFLAALLYPSLKIVLITHGIEVWSELGFLKKKVLRRADKIIAVSSFTKNKITEKHSISANKITVFPNTIDPYFQYSNNFIKSDELRTKHQLPPNCKLILTIGRINTAEGYKGYDRVIEVLPQVVKENPNIRYIIIGKYDNAEKQRLDLLIEKMGVSEYVIFTGFVTDKELYDYYLSGNLFVMPSKGEGFGIVFIEALVSGLPVVAGNKDGSTDALDNGRLGTLIDPDDNKQLTDAICDILQQNENIEDKKVRQSKTLQKFGFDKFRLRLQTIIEEFL